MPSSNILSGQNQLAVAKDAGYSFQSVSTNTNALLETPMILIKNASLTKLMNWLEFHYSGNTLSNVQTTVVRIYKDPVITANGAGIAVVPMRNASAPSAMQIFQSPTIIFNGVLIYSIVMNFQGVSIPCDLAKIMIEAGDNFLVTFQANQANQPANFGASWIEA